MQRHSLLILHLQHQHPTWVPILGPAAALPIQLPANMVAKHWRIFQALRFLELSHMQPHGHTLWLELSHMQPRGRTLWLELSHAQLCGHTLHLELSLVQPHGHTLWLEQLSCENIWTHLSCLQPRGHSSQLELSHVDTPAAAYTLVSAFGFRTLLRMS